MTIRKDFFGLFLTIALQATLMGFGYIGFEKFQTYRAGNRQWSYRDCPIALRVGLSGLGLGFTLLLGCASGAIQLAKPAESRLSPRRNKWLSYALAPVLLIGLLWGGHPRGHSRLRRTTAYERWAMSSSGEGVGLFGKDFGRFHLLNRDWTGVEVFVIGAGVAVLYVLLGGPLPPRRRD